MAGRDLTVRLRTSFLFINNGDRTSEGDSASNTTTNHTYDMADRLISYAKGSTSVNYTYNGDGLRVAMKVNGGSAEHFVWDQAEGMPLLIQDGSTKEITGPGGLPLEQLDGSGTVLFYLQEQLMQGQPACCATGKGGSAHGRGPYHVPPKD